MTSINAPCVVCGIVGDADETDFGWVCSEKLSCFDRLKSNPPQLRSRPPALDPIDPPPQRDGEEKRSAATRCDLMKCHAEPPHPPHPHYEQPARALEKSQNGFIMCRVCESVQPAAGHECVWAEAEIAGIEAKTEELVAHFGTVDSIRAEHAESLLCAMAFDHGTWRAHEGRLCFTDCAFCESAR